MSYDMYDDMTARVNARLDDDLAAKLEQTRKLTGKSTSTILKDALKLYFSNEARAGVSPGEALLRSGFVGCGSGEPDTSTNYKKILGELLARKHGLDEHDPR